MLINRIYGRETIPKYTKYKEKPEEGKHLINYPTIKEYDYYKCDYCGKEIIISNKKQEITGGIVIFPDTLTKKGNLEVVLHNKCLNLAIKEIEEHQLMEKNYNHIPRLD